MQITRTNVSSTQIKLLISADAEELSPIKDEVVKRLGKNVKLPGFRPGKAPQALIEKNIEPALLQNDFLDEAMTRLYAKATREENIRPVTRPEVSIKKFVPFTELEYEVTTSIIGKITLSDYKNHKVEKQKVKITAKDIDEVIKNLQTRMADKNEVSRPAKSGDEAVIDFKGVDAKGKDIDGAAGTDYPLGLGSGSFIPGFEENVIGMKPGEEKTFEITFPDDYGAKELAGAKVKFTVTLKKLNELKQPKLDDEFAKKVGPFKTTEELKEDIRRQLTDEKEREAESKYQDEVVKAVSEKAKLEIPEPLLEQQVIYNIDELRRNLTYQGQTYDEYLKSQGKTEEELKEELKPQATQQLKASLVLSEIAEKEGLTVEPEELDVRIKLYKAQYNDPTMQAELGKPENRSDIASRMLTEKVLNLLTNN